MMDNFEARLASAAGTIATLKAAVGKIIVGQSAVVDQVMWGLVAGGAGCVALPALADAPPPSTPDVLSGLLSVELLAVFAYARVSTHPGLTPTVASVTARVIG